jgi:hypothetical protein
MSKQDSIDRAVKSQIDREGFRQARILFYSAITIAAISASVTLIGVGEMLIGNPQGTDIILGGLQASVSSIRLTQTAIDRTKKISDKSND